MHVVSHNRGAGGLVAFAAFALLLGHTAGVVVPCTHGDVRGAEFPTSSIGNAVFDRIYTFKGIPYAAPPVGDLRWRPPQDPASWTGVRDVTRFGDRCPQVFDIQAPAGTLLYEITRWRSDNSSEDCLFLNVFTPDVSSTADLPVMFWLHGGGMGIGSADSYPAEIPTSLHNVIMVTINYRLGNLGFLPIRDDNVAGNFGLLDMKKALQWVQANIRNFGGDPDRVTIFGQSGGGWAVSLLVMSPETEGLFHRAISQSGVAGIPTRRKGDMARTESLARGLNCSTSEYDDMMSCLRGKTAINVLALEATVPVFGGRFLPETPWDLMHKKQVNKVDYLLGTTNYDFGYSLLYSRPYVTQEGISRTVFEDNLPTELQFIVDQYPGGSTSVSSIVQPVLDQYRDPDRPDDPIAIRDQFSQLMLDSWFIAPTVMMAQAASAPDVRVYQYELQHGSSVFPGRPADTGADHGDDLFYMFGIPFLRDVTGSSWKHNFTQEERELSLDMMAYWVNFAANGDPNDSTGAARMRDMVNWPRYSPSSQEYLKLDVTSSADSKLRETRMKFWNEEVPKLMGKQVTTSDNGGTQGRTRSLFVLIILLVVTFAFVS